MDALGYLFKNIQVKTVVYTNLELSSPWGINFKSLGHVKFGLVLSGSSFIRVEGFDGIIPLNTGNCILLPRGPAFQVFDSETTSPIHFKELVFNSNGGTVKFGGGGQISNFIGGSFIFNLENIPSVFDLLPDIVHFSIGHKDFRYFENTLLLLQNETASKNMGKKQVIDSLAEVFLIQIFRAYLQSGSTEDISWIGAAGNKKISNAIRLIHTSLEIPWTIESLARSVAMSRTSFANQFKKLVGITPIDYLTNCRMAYACRILRDTNIQIDSIATKSGYLSSESFTRTFKKRIGTTPQAYRKSNSALYKTC